ncbi:MAG TPA: hypothetical protein DDZ51_21810, partial [Planctomycetaceae bacterium]|nr:hypothetical protein [Planctomycetaceae bacterium]
RPPTNITRPITPDRPSIGGNRPNYNNRPGANDWVRPGYPDRPIIGDRPDRPIIGGGNLVVGGGNSNININNNVNNWFGNSNWGWGNQSGWNQGWGWNSGWNQPSWYNGHWNAHWGTSWYRPAPNYYVGWGLGTWATYTTFVNPYYVPTTTTVYNYAQPIVVDSVARSAPLQSAERVGDEPDADTVALELFNEGVAAFYDGNFVVALNKFDTAMHRLSGDPVLHEMRALTYFALGKYQESAAVLNALLAASPGMDWTTLSGLYGDIELYTQQLRKLETHIEANPKDAAALFVLSYHYLVTGHVEDAVDLLADVVQLQPSDTTATQMLRALTAADDRPQTPASGEAPPAKAVDVSRVANSKKADDSDQSADDDQPKTDLVGKWIATPTGVTITLEVTEASTFTWRAEPKPVDDKPAAEPMELSGDVLAGGETLILNTESQGAMTGQVESGGADQFRFIVPGGPPDDPGLTFNRQK